MFAVMAAVSFCAMREDHDPVSDHAIPALGSSLEVTQAAQLDDDARQPRSAPRNVETVAAERPMTADPGATSAQIAAAQVLTIGLWSLLSLVSVTFVSFFFLIRYSVRRSMRAHLTALTASMMTIADGDLSAQIPPASNDEYGSMAAAIRAFHETAVELRDVQESQIRLQHTIKQLQQSNAARSNFIANVSLELRTPLTAVLGFAQIVQTRLENVIFPAMQSDDNRTERAVLQVRENISIMIAEGQRLTKMIDDILDLEKIETGQMEWDIESLDMGSVIRQAAAATSHLYHSKNLAFRIDVAKNLPPVSADRDRVVQVMTNLISNAVKFTDHGHVACVASLGNGPFVSVSVRDTGEGIAPEHQDGIFDKFRPSRDTSAEALSGTGLGLPICREIIEHLGGTINVQSMPGYGSTFTFELPLADTGPAADQAISRIHGP